MKMMQKVWAPDSPEDLSSAVFQAVGSASMCWQNMSTTGVFDDVQAKAVGDGLIKWIAENTPQVELIAAAGKPTVCRVSVGGVLRFFGTGTLHELYEPSGMDEFAADPAGADPDPAVTEERPDMAQEDVYARLEELGIDRARFARAMEDREDWGGMVHAFEFLSVLGVVLSNWPDPEPEPEPAADGLGREPGRRPSLVQDLAAVLNRHSAENGSDTPDFILADLLHRVLFAFDVATLERGSWYGHKCSIGNCNHEDGLA